MALLSDVVFPVLVFITVALTAVAIGLVTSVDLIRQSLQRRSYLIVVFLNIVIVPPVAYLVTSSFPLDSSLETAVVLCAICAGGPLGIKVSQLANGDMSWTLSLVVVLLLMNVITLPLWTSVLFDQSLTLGPTDLMGSLVVAIVIPVLVGSWLRRRSPEASERRYEKVTNASNIFLVLAVAVGVAANMQGLIESVASWMMLTSAVVIVIAGTIGWIPRETLPWRSPAALITLNRATSVGLLVASRAFADNAELITGVIVFGTVQTALAVGWSLYLRQAQTKAIAA